MDDLFGISFQCRKIFVGCECCQYRRTGHGVRNGQKELGMNVDTDLENASDNICQLAVQGPLALKAMQN